LPLFGLTWRKCVLSQVSPLVLSFQLPLFPLNLRGPASVQLP
jgi:hypothetical protein